MILFPYIIIWEFLFMDNEDNVLTGFTCTTCGKIFETEEEFKNRHKKKNKSKSQEDKKKD